MSDPDPISRRQLLRLAGSVGVASLMSACVSDTRTTSTRLTASTAAQLICRDAWGARPPRPGGKRHTITRMTLHHEAVVLGDNRNAPERLRKDQRYHQDQHGWIDIAYHVGVDRNGNLYELRSTEIAGDTATDYDTTGHFLVLCEVDFYEEAVSEAQLHEPLSHSLGCPELRYREHYLGGPSRLRPGSHAQARISTPTCPPVTSSAASTVCLPPVG